MRAYEFIKEESVGQATARLPSGEEIKITVPVTINMEPQDGGEVNISGGGKVNTTIAEPATTKYPSEPLWVYPGQQMLELAKQGGGKQSPVINQIIKSDNGPDSDPDDGVFAQLDNPDADPDNKRSVYYDSALKSGY